MPEMRFTIRWPDGRRETCYSPSLVVCEYLREGASYELPEFLRLARASLGLASERVKAKYGFACSRALGQLARIEDSASKFANVAGAEVVCEILHVEPTP